MVGLSKEMLRGMQKASFEKQNEILQSYDDKRSVFHYTTVGAMFDILRTQTLQITKSNFLNDPFETIHIYSTFEDIFREISGSSKEKYVQNGVRLDKAVLMSYYLAMPNAYKQYRSAMSSDEAFILSLTKNSDSMPLWSSFGRDEGCNIGFASQLEFSSLKSELILRGRVIYDSEEQKKVIDNITVDALSYLVRQGVDINELDEDSQWRILGHILFVMDIYSLFFKSHGFKSEEEYRIVFVFGDNTAPVEFRQRRGTVIPYIEYPLPTVTSVCLAPSNKSDFVRNSLEYYFSKRSANVDLRLSEFTLTY